jgi:hypothetical protein
MAHADHNQAKDRRMSSPMSSGQDGDAMANLPDELQLQLAPGQAGQFAVRVTVDGDIRWNITQVGSGAQLLTAGETQTLTLSLPPTSQPHALIRGRVEIVRRADGALLRSIPVAGWVRKPCAAKSVAEQSPQIPRHWLKWLVVVLVLGTVVIGVLHFSRCPTLVIKPARLDLGTLWYSPPVGGNIQTVLVFSVQWQVPPRNAVNPVLIAHKQLHYAGETGQGTTPEETFVFPLNYEITEARIPLECYGLSNEIVRVGGTISLTLSNAEARVMPDQIRFDAQFKPAGSP